MKILKYILTVGIIMTMTSCFDEPTGISTKVPVDTPDPEPILSPDDDVTSPRPRFSCEARDVVFNINQKFQTAEGFGASDCWLPN